jgi:hypothetical protein
VPSTRTRKWLPEIANFNIFVLAHKNVIEPAGFLLVWQKPGSCVSFFNHAVDLTPTIERGIF